MRPGAGNDSVSGIMILNGEIMRSDGILASGSERVLDGFSSTSALHDSFCNEFLLNETLSTFTRRKHHG